MKQNNPWKHAEVDPARLKDNRFVHPEKKPTTHGEQTPTENGIEDNLDCLIIKNITCKDADGKIIEHHDEIHVAKDIVRKDNNGHIWFTPYHAITYFEQKSGLFLPSFALTCNILEELYHNRNDPEINKILMQYKNYGFGCGYHVQNTVVDWKNRKIIHYPCDKDFPEYGGDENVNQARPKIILNFNSKEFKGMLLEEALKIPDFKRYLQNLTGLPNPEILIEIGNHLGKTTEIRVPKKPRKANHTSAVGLGCYNNYFNVSTYDRLKFGSAAREVRVKN